MNAFNVSFLLSLCTTAIAAVPPTTAEVNAAITNVLKFGTPLTPQTIDVIDNTTNPPTKQTLVITGKGLSRSCTGYTHPVLMVFTHGPNRETPTIKVLSYVNDVEIMMYDSTLDGIPDGKYISKKDVTPDEANTAFANTIRCIAQGNATAK